MSDSNENIIVKDLKVHFPNRSGLLGKVDGWTKAVDGVSFSVKKGEVFALVGESGCGKTTTAQAIMGLLPITDGSVHLRMGPYKDRHISWEELSNKKRKSLRRHIQIIFQDPYSSLNPRMNVKAILDEPLAIHGYSFRARTERIHKLLDQVGLSKSYLNRYPHEFSGGQRQRIGIARALATSPELVVADEPVSALDVSIQAQIINLLQELQSTYNQTLLFISHDLAVVHHMANRVAVMYLGKIVEMGTESQIFSSPLHPYTNLLLKSVPTVGQKSSVSTTVSTDERSNPDGSGCSFYSRCPRRSDNCRLKTPELREFGDGHVAACHNPEADVECSAPKLEDEE
ncbi:MAG: ABC transporter ATP-binding protein [Chitinispirillaceae bacterium]